jgi:hypothetical protein
MYSTVIPSNIHIPLRIFPRGPPDKNNIVDKSSHLTNNGFSSPSILGKNDYSLEVLVDISFVIAPRRTVPSRTPVPNPNSGKVPA